MKPTKQLKLTENLKFVSYLLQKSSINKGLIICKQNLIVMIMDNSCITQNQCNSTKTGNYSLYATSPSGFRPAKKTKRQRQDNKRQWQSASTWRYSSLSHRFSKQSRFSTSKANHSDIIDINIPQQLNTKTCTFGFGKRQAISPIIMRRANQTPSPNRYNMKTLDEATRSSQRGIGFCSGRDSLVCRYTQHRKDAHSPNFTIDNPGHIYNIRQRMNAKPIKFGKKLKNFTQKMADSKNFIPGPKYNPQDRALYNQTGLGNASFGTGKRKDLSKPMNQNPGPQYMISGMAYRFHALQEKYNF